MSRNFIFSVDEFYHCYNRGTEKRQIFMDHKDYERFISLLYTCNSKDPVHLSDFQNKNFYEIFDISREDTLVDIGVYCLMPNHFHILIKEKSEKGISTFMQKIMTAYTMYFNKKYNRTGSLFAGRFKAQHVNNDNYLKYIYSYIHLNPVKLINKDWKESGLKNKKLTIDFLNNYSYSSYLDYVEKLRPHVSILNKKTFPSYFKNKTEHLIELFDWLNYVKVQP